MYGSVPTEMRPLGCASKSSHRMSAWALGLRPLHRAVRGPQATSELNAPRSRSPSRQPRDGLRYECRRYGDGEGLLPPRRRRSFRIELSLRPRPAFTMCMRSRVACREIPHARMVQPRAQNALQRRGDAPETHDPVACSKEVWRPLRGRRRSKFPTRVPARCSIVGRTASRCGAPGERPGCAHRPRRVTDRRLEASGLGNRTPAC